MIVMQQEQQQGDAEIERIKGELSLEIRDIARIIDGKAADIRAGIVNGTISIPYEQDGPRILIRRKYAESIRQQLTNAQSQEGYSSVEYILVPEAAKILDRSADSVTSAARNGSIEGKQELRMTNTGKRYVWFLNKGSVLAYREKIRNEKRGKGTHARKAANKPVLVSVTVAPPLPIPAIPTTPRLQDLEQLKDIALMPEEEFHQSFPATLSILDVFNYLEGLLTHQQLVLLVHNNQIPSASSDRSGNYRFDKDAIRKYKYELLKKREREEAQILEQVEEILPELVPVPQPAPVAPTTDDASPELEEQQLEEEIVAVNITVITEDEPKTEQSFAAEPVRNTPTPAKQSYHLMQRALEMAYGSLSASEQNSLLTDMHRVAAPIVWDVTFTDVNTDQKVVKTVLYTGRNYFILVNEGRKEE